MACVAGMNVNVDSKKEEKGGAPMISAGMGRGGFGMGGEGWRWSGFA